MPFPKQHGPLSHRTVPFSPRPASNEVSLTLVVCQRTPSPGNPTSCCMLLLCRPLSSAVSTPSILSSLWQASPLCGKSAQKLVWNFLHTLAWTFTVVHSFIVHWPVTGDRWPPTTAHTRWTYTPQFRVTCQVTTQVFPVRKRQSDSPHDPISFSDGHVLFWQIRCLVRQSFGSRLLQVLPSHPSWKTQPSSSWSPWRLTKQFVPLHQVPLVLEFPPLAVLLCHNWTAPTASCRLASAHLTSKSDTHLHTPCAPTDTVPRTPSVPQRSLSAPDPQPDRMSHAITHSRSFLRRGKDNETAHRRSVFTSKSLHNVFQRSQPGPSSRVPNGPGPSSPVSIVCGATLKKSTHFTTSPTSIWNPSPQESRLRKKNITKTNRPKVLLCRTSKHHQHQHTEIEGCSHTSQKRIAR